MNKLEQFVRELRGMSGLTLKTGARKLGQGNMTLTTLGAFLAAADRGREQTHLTITRMLPGCSDPDDPEVRYPGGMFIVRIWVEGDELLSQIYDRKGRKDVRVPLNLVKQVLVSKPAMPSREAAVLFGYRPPAKQEPAKQEPTKQETSSCAQTGPDKLAEMRAFRPGR